LLKYESNNLECLGSFYFGGVIYTGGIFINEADFLLFNFNLISAVSKGFTASYPTDISVGAGNAEIFFEGIYPFNL
jgi:hypothetical protein